MILTFQNKSACCMAWRHGLTHVRTYSSAASSHDYILNRVKTSDYESYVTSLLQQRSLRYPLMILQSYNVELSSALESTSDPKTAMGRFVFWREVLDRIFNGSRPPDHPVAQELNKLYHLQLKGSGQSRRRLLDMIQSRETLASTTHTQTLDQLETYCEQTRSSLLYLTLAVYKHSSLDADHAASHLGRCTGLITALRATPYLASKSQILIPQDALSKHGVSQTDVLRGRAAVKEPAFEIASQAHIHLEKCKTIVTSLPKEIRICFLSYAICEIQLELLRKVDFNLFDPQFHRKTNLLMWKLWRAKRKLGRMKPAS